MLRRFTAVAVLLSCIAIVAVSATQGECYPCGSIEDPGSYVRATIPNPTCMDYLTSPVTQGVPSSVVLIGDRTTTANDMGMEPDGSLIVVGTTATGTDFGGSCGAFSGADNFVALYGENGDCERVASIATLPDAVESGNGGVYMSSGTTLMRWDSQTHATDWSVSVSAIKFVLLAPIAGGVTVVGVTQSDVALTSGGTAVPGCEPLSMVAHNAGESALFFLSLFENGTCSSLRMLGGTALPTEMLDTAAGSWNQLAENLVIVSATDRAVTFEGCDAFEAPASGQYGSFVLRLDVHGNCVYGETLAISTDIANGFVVYESVLLMADELRAGDTRDPDIILSGHFKARMHIDGCGTYNNRGNQLSPAFFVGRVKGYDEASCDWIHIYTTLTTAVTVLDTVVPHALLSVYSASAVEKVWEFSAFANVTGWSQTIAHSSGTREATSEGVARRVRTVVTPSGNIASLGYSTTGHPGAVTRFGDCGSLTLKVPEGQVETSQPWLMRLSPMGTCLWRDCQACTHGRRSVLPLMDSCACGPGSTLVDGQCSACSAGTFKPGFNDSTPCMPCKSGTQSEKGANHCVADAVTLSGLIPFAPSTSLLLAGASVLLGSCWLFFCVRQLRAVPPRSSKRERELDEVRILQTERTSSDAL